MTNMGMHNQTSHQYMPGNGMGNMNNMSGGLNSINNMNSMGQMNGMSYGASRHHHVSINIFA